MAARGRLSPAALGPEVQTQCTTGGCRVDKVLAWTLVGFSRPRATHPHIPLSLFPLRFVQEVESPPSALKLRLDHSTEGALNDPSKRGRPWIRLPLSPVDKNQPAPLSPSPSSIWQKRRTPDITESPTDRDHPLLSHLCTGLPFQ